VGLNLQFEAVFPQKSPIIIFLFRRQDIKTHKNKMSQKSWTSIYSDSIDKHWLWSTLFQFAAVNDIFVFWRKIFLWNKIDAIIKICCFTFANINVKVNHELYEIEFYANKGIVSALLSMIHIATVDICDSLTKKY
jgi:hypothetical protein